MPRPKTLKLQNQGYEQCKGDLYVDKGTPKEVANALLALCQDFAPCMSKIVGMVTQCISDEQVKKRYSKHQVRIEFGNVKTGQKFINPNDSWNETTGYLTTTQRTSDNDGMFRFFAVVTKFGHNIGLRYFNTDEIIRISRVNRKRGAVVWQNPKYQSETVPRKFKVEIVNPEKCKRVVMAKTVSEAREKAKKLVEGTDSCAHVVNYVRV